MPTLPFVDLGFVAPDFVDSDTTPRQFSTDFREYRRGRVPGDWTERWLTGSGLRVEGSAYDLPHRNALLLTGGFGTQRCGVSWNVAGIGNYTNTHMLGRFRTIIRGNGGSETISTVVILRGAGTAAAPTAYRALIDIAAGTLTVNKLVAGASTNLGTSAAKNVRLRSYYLVRFEASGTTIRGKLWADGDAEPGAWDVSVTDSSISAAGWTGLQLFYADEQWYCKYFAVGTNGATPPDESTIDAPLDSWISEPDNLNITYRFEYFDASDLTVKDVWVSRYPLRTRASDYPASTVMEGLISDAGSLTSRLESDIYLSGLSSFDRSPIKLANLPTSPTSPGPLDAWRAYSFYGRPVETRMGRLWAVKPTATTAGVLTAHRRYEIVGCSIMATEPEIGGAEVVANLSTPMSILGDQVVVRRNVGIPTAVKSVTALGWVSIPSNAAYDLASYKIMARVFVPAGGVTGSGIAEISKRESGGSLRTWYVGLYHASHATLANRLHFSVHNASGVNIVSATYLASALFGSWLDIIVGLQGSSRWYVIVNGMTVMSGTIASDPIPNSGVTVQLLRSAIGLLICDHRIEQFQIEDDALSRFGTRSDPDQFTISMHRCDDATGNTVTDYAALANHGTLQGVDPTDRVWAPSYLGSPELSGVPMPISAGVIYHGPTQPIDSTREIFRYNDRSKTIGATVEVRVRGVIKTITTDYTEPSDGPGTIDNVGATDQPVTIGLKSAAGAEDPSTHVPTLVRNDLMARGSLSYRTCDIDSFDGLRVLHPRRGGYVYQQPPTISDLLSQQLGSIASYFTLDQSARVYAGCMLPAINPGPYGAEYLLEFLGQPNSGVTFSANSAFNLNDTLAGGTNPFYGVAAWIKLPITPYRDPAAVMGTYLPSGMTVVDRVDGASGYYLGIDGRDGSIIWGAPGVTGNSTGLHYLSYQYPFVAGQAYFIACYQDLNTRQIFVASQTDLGVAITTSKSESTTGAMTVATNAPLLIGHGARGAFYGWIGYVLGSSAALSDSDFVDITAPDAFNIRTQRWVQSAVSSARWGQTRYLINMTEGAGDIATDAKSGRRGRIRGCRWCPKLILDFRVPPTTLTTIADLSSTRRPVPAWRVEARYKYNLAPLIGANAAAGVTAADRISLALPYLSEIIASGDVRDHYLNSRDVAMDTPCLDAAGANAVARLIKSRISVSRLFADCQNWSVEVLKLLLTDEILIYHPRYGLDVGRSMRVDMLTSRLLDMLGDIGAWG